MLKLVISDDEGKTTVVPLVRDEITIGRKEGNTIRLTERNVSRKHAKLRRLNGGFLVEDLGSYNGIKVNGRRIDKESALQAGDQIGIGDYMLALQEEAAAAARDEAAAAAAAAAAVAAAPAIAVAGAPIPVTVSTASAPTAEIVSPIAVIPVDAPTAMVAAPPVDVGPPARLVMVSPPAPGAEFALSRARVRIGRAEDLEICVTHKSISREHAELTIDGGVLRARDLGSANGMRLNGRDTKDTVVSPGDVLELGQVRFKYVAAGATYTFDEGRTVQMEALPGGAPKSRTPILIAAGIVIIALLGVVAMLAFGGGGGGNDTVTTTPVSTGDGTGVAIPPTPPVGPSGNDAAYATALAGCQTAVAAGQWPQALTQAQAALALRQGDPAAADCQARASAGATAQSTFDRGVAAAGQGNLEDAYVTFEQLPPDSPLRQRPEVAQITAAYARGVLARAQALVGSDAPQATRLATTVAMMQGLPPDLVQQAAAIQAAAHQTALAVNDYHPPPPPHGGGNPPHGGGNPPHGGGNPPHGGGNNNVPPHGGGNNVIAPPPPPPPPPPPDDGSRIVTARACAINGDSNCVIRVLQGARTQAEMDMLIQAYRDKGDLNSALPVMRRYVERYPSSGHVNQYRQILNLHGG